MVKKGEPRQTDRLVKKREAKYVCVVTERESHRKKEKEAERVRRVPPNFFPPSSSPFPPCSNVFKVRFEPLRSDNDIPDKTEKQTEDGWKEERNPKRQMNEKIQNKTYKPNQSNNCHKLREPQKC